MNTMNTAAISGSALDGLGLPTTTKAKGNDELGQDAFLQLMVTQLQNQDPTKPLDSNEFIAQLAQFSSVSSLSDMSKSIAQLSEAIYANQAVQASSLIGRNVLVAGDSGVLRDGQSLTGGVDLPTSTASATVRVFNAAGEVVRQIPLGPQDAGLVRFSWDGADSAGNPLPAGRYRFAAAIPASGGLAERALDTYSSTRVTSIALSTDLASSTITTDSGAELRLAQIKAID
jgi:flagellar basal-body rod modification protein FlgD